MAALEDSIASLGSPLLLRALSASSAVVVTIARRRHGATTVGRWTGIVAVQRTDVDGQKRRHFQFARLVLLEHGDQGVGHDVRPCQQRHVISWHDQRVDAKPRRKLGAGTR